MANRNDSLGYDMYCRDDIDRGGRSSSGAELVTSAILHRLTTGNLPLIDSPNGFEEYGDDVRKWIGGTFAEDQLRVRAAGLGIIVERDPRVSEATVTGTFSLASGALISFALGISAKLRTGEKIDLVVGVPSMTVEILSQGR